MISYKCILILGPIHTLTEQYIPSRIYFYQLIYLSVSRLSFFAILSLFLSYLHCTEALYRLL
jgi:hypothetical protein